MVAVGVRGVVSGRDSGRVLPALRREAWLAWGAALFLCLASSPLWPDDLYKVHVEFTKSVDFHGFKTFEWAPREPGAEDRVHEVLITHAIELELVAKGLRRATPPEAPDLLVQYAESVEKRIEGTPTRTDSPWQPSSPRFTVQFGKVEIETVVVELREPKEGAVLWQGRESCRLGNLEDVDGEITDLLHQILSGYPPKGKSKKPKS